MRKRRKKRQRIATVVLCLLLLVVAAGIGFFGKKILDGESTRTQAFQEGGYTAQPSTAAGAEPSVTADTTETESVTATPEATETPTPTPEPTLEVQTVSGENLHSAHAILIRAEDGAVMMEKAASEQTYPASITKVMTAILAIEQLADLEEQVTVPEDIFEELTAQGASVAGFDPYEQLSVRSLLYGVLLPSGVTMYDSMFTKFDNSGISTTMANGLSVQGGKTGFTDEAGQCLASFGSLNGMEYILVTTGAPAQNGSEIMSVQDAETIYSRISGAQS